MSKISFEEASAKVDRLNADGSLKSKNEWKREVRRFMTESSKNAKKALVCSESIQKKPKTESNVRETKKPRETILAFDCRFDDLMSMREIVSLSNQLKESYSRNLHMQIPLKMMCFRFYFLFSCLFVITFSANFNLRSDSKDKLWNQMSKLPINNWVNFELLDYHFDNSFFVDYNLFYLSSEAENDFPSEIPEKSVIIIGGIVDKNRHKNLTHKLAVENKIPCFKLPIVEYLELNSSW